MFKLINNRQNEKGFAIIEALLLVVILVLVASIGYIVYSEHYNLKPNSNTSVSSVTKSKVSNSSTSCTSQSCFNPLFSKCTPSTLNYLSPLASVKYQIFGPKGTGCSMLFEYTSNPNPAWKNQPMTCNFNNKIPLDNSIQNVINDLISKSNTYSCTGPLVNLLQSS